MYACVFDIGYSEQGLEKEIVWNNKEIETLSCFKLGFLTTAALKYIYI